MLTKRWGVGPLVVGAGAAVLLACGAGKPALDGGLPPDGGNDAGGGDAGRDGGGDAGQDSGSPLSVDAPTLATPFDDGARFFQGADGGAVTLTAVVHDATDGAVSAHLDVRVVGQAAVQVAGALTGADAGGAAQWAFVLPRALGLAGGACGTAPCDGTSPLVATAYAQDTLGNRGTSPALDVFLDAVGPVCAIADAGWYSANVTIPVPVSAVDPGSGVNGSSAAMTDGTASPYAGSCDAGVCTFNVQASDFTVASGRREGALGLSFQVADNVGNRGSAAGYRRVDGEPPTVAISSLSPAAGGASGTSYPAAFSGTGFATGHDGAHYVWGEPVHVTASVQDADGFTTGSGIRLASLQARVDGLVGTSPVMGTPVNLTASPPYNLNTHGCSDGDIFCVVDFDLPLIAPLEPGQQPDGMLGVSVLATDVVGNAGASAVGSVRATRFWWSRALPVAGPAVTGLAVHPNGVVVATTNAASNSDSLFAFFNDGPFNTGAGNGCAGGPFTGISWCTGHDFYGAGVGLGGLSGASIGDDLNGQQVYVTTGGGDVVAMTGAGTKSWNCGKGVFGSGLLPAVVTTASVSTAMNCEAVLFASGTSVNATCNPTGTTCRSAAASTTQAGASPGLMENATFYVGTSGKVAETSLSLGSFTTVNFFGSALGAIAGLAFDGSQLYATSNASGTVYQFAPSLTAGFTAPFSPLAPQGLPVVAAARLIASDTGSALRTVPVSGTGTVTPGTLAGLAHPAFTPLLGADGRVYVGEQGGVVAAVDSTNGALAWSFAAASATDFAVPSTLDCAGHLYAAAGGTVYAFSTDAQGLMNTPWPKYQRDTRNTGNADRVASHGAPYGVNNDAACVQ